MKTLVLVLSTVLLIMCGTVFALTYELHSTRSLLTSMQSTIEDLTVRNAAQSSTHWRFKGINEAGVRDASFLYPGTEKMLVALRRKENGTKAELGVHGKTWPLCLYPPESWQYLEAARLVSDEACQYALSPEHYREFILKHLGPRYNTAKEYPGDLLTLYRAELLKTHKRGKR